MITNKQDYWYFVQADLEANEVGRWKFRHRFSRQVIYFQRLLRKVEYYKNCRKDLLGRLYYYFLLYRFRKLSIQLGFTIYPNVFGPGLSIAHYGSIIVSHKSKVGKNCRVHSDVNIGEGKGNAPIIGDNVYIGPGVKIFGGIRIGDNVQIGANAVVNKDVESNVMVAGVPAKVIRNHVV